MRFFSNKVHFAFLSAGVSVMALLPAVAEAQQAPSVGQPRQSQNGDETSSPVTPASSPTPQAAAAPGAQSDIVVTGIRKSLQNAQNIKRNADVFVDAITADDMSALPDKSVVEALQRVPGVSVTRYAALSDPDHFSIEGSGAVIRGLDNVRSELNGRDVFAASGGQGISFNAISPELIGSVEVFKNQSADMIEGGIAGTIDLNVRRPFDFNGQRIGFSIEGDYGDMAQKMTPTISGTYSNRWHTRFGDIGVLVGGVFSKLNARSDASGSRRWLQIDGPDGDPVWVTHEINFRQTNYDRKRNSETAALQWRSPDQTLDATFQFFRLGYTNTYDENSLESDTGVSTDIVPAPGTEWLFNDKGVFDKGTLTLPTQDGRNPGTFGDFPEQGFGLTNASQGMAERTVTTDYGFKVGWQPTSRLHLSLDTQYVASSRTVANFTVGAQTYANATFDFTGTMPRVTLLAPPDASVQGPEYFADLSSWYPAWAMDHLEDNKAHSYSIRADGKYDFDTDWLKAIRFGARFARRDQTLRSTTYNWNTLSQSWTGGQVPLSDADIVPAGLWTIQNFNHHFRRSQSALGLEDGFAMWGGPRLGANYKEAAAAIYTLAQNIAGASTGGSWRPLAMRDGVIDGTPFLPSDIGKTHEDTDAYYIRFDFGDDHRFSWNVGARYVITRASSQGSVAFPNGNEILRSGDGTIRSVAQYCSPERTDTTAPLTLNDVPAPCINDFVISNQATGEGGYPNGFDNAESFFRWANNAVLPVDLSHTYKRLLPSLNMKYKLTDKLITRLGIARAMSRPNFGDLASNYTFGTGELFQDTRSWSGPTASGGNVNLNPLMSDQVDFSLEWYFSRVGSLTGTIFYKKLTNAIVNQYVTESFENNGETFDVRLDSKGNQNQKAIVKGFELAYQQSFDMLPAPFDGLGTQLNYTFLKTTASPVLSVNLNDASVLVPIDVSSLSRQGLSKHTVNAVGFYEKNGFSLRVAYNWRSSYLLDPRDGGEPFYPISSGSVGYLDASVSYALTKHLRIGIEGNNLTNTKNRTYNLVNDEYLRTPRNLTISDRLYTFYLRGTF